MIFVDRQPCPQQSATQQGRCSGTPLQDTVGVSGVSFSLDRGNSWVQPKYGGWTKANCTRQALAMDNPGRSTRCPGTTRATSRPLAFPNSRCNRSTRQRIAAVVREAAELAAGRLEQRRLPPLRRVGCIRIRT
jgi:hypothetical protein